MEKKLTLLEGFVASGLAAIADVGSGLMLAVIVGKIDGRFFHQHWLTVCIGSVFFALLPDFDILLKLAWTMVKSRIKKNGNQQPDLPDGHHRAILHQPSLFGLVFILWFVLALALHWHLVYPLLFLSGGLLHFLHDSVEEHDQEGKGRNIGVPWLSPLDRRTFVFGGRSEDGQDHLIVARPANFVTMEHKEWLETFYLRINLRLIIELGWFLLWTVAIAKIVF